MDVEFFFLIIQGVFYTDASYYMAHSMTTQELHVLPSLGVRELRLTEVR